MASFTAVDDVINLTVPAAGENIKVALSGTYSMVIELQKKVGDGAWFSIQSWSTANATVAAYYTTKGQGEILRLIVTTDTSGTCTATLTDESDVVLHELGGVGVSPAPLQVLQSGVKINGAMQGGAKKVNDLTASSYTALEMAAMADSLMLFNLAGGIDTILPAATGSGKVYEFIVLTATTDGYTIEVATGGGDFNGVILGKADTVTTAERHAAGATDNTLTLGGTGQATGGTVGDHIRIIDIATNEWFIEGTITQGGTEATPFSAA